MKFNLERVENSLKYNIEALFNLGLPRDSDAAINLARMVLRMLANIKKLQDQVEHKQNVDTDIQTIEQAEVALQRNLTAVNNYIINTIIAFFPPEQRNSVQLITDNIRAAVLESELEMRRLFNEAKKLIPNNLEDENSEYSSVQEIDEEDEQIDKSVDDYISILNELFDGQKVEISHDKDNDQNDPVLKLIISDDAFSSYVKRAMLWKKYPFFYMGGNEFQLLLTKKTKAELTDQDQFDELKAAIIHASKNKSFINFNYVKKVNSHKTQGSQKKEPPSANITNPNDGLNLDVKELPTSNCATKNDANENNDVPRLIDSALKGIFRLGGAGAGGCGGFIAGGILGSMFGSVVPIVGTAIGGIIGSVIGLGVGMLVGYHSTKQAARGARAIVSITSEKKLDGREVSLTNPLKYNISNNVLTNVNQTLATDTQTTTSDQVAYHFMKQLRAAKNASILRKIPYTDSKAKKEKLNQYISAVKKGSLAVGTDGQIYAKENGKYTLFLTQHQINNLLKAKSTDIKDLPPSVSKRKG